MSNTREPHPPTQQAWAWSWLQRRWVRSAADLAVRPSESSVATASWILPR